MVERWFCPSNWNARPAVPYSAVNETGLPLSNVKIISFPRLLLSGEVTMDTWTMFHRRGPNPTLTLSMPQHPADTLGGWRNQVCARVGAMVGMYSPIKSLPKVGSVVFTVCIHVYAPGQYENRSTPVFCVLFFTWNIVWVQFLRFFQMFSRTRERLRMNGCSKQHTLHVHEWGHWIEIGCFFSQICCRMIR